MLSWDEFDKEDEVDLNAVKPAPMQPIPTDRCCGRTGWTDCRMCCSSD